MSETDVVVREQSNQHVQSVCQATTAGLDWVWIGVVPGYNKLVTRPTVALRLEPLHYNLIES